MTIKTITASYQVTKQVRQFEPVVIKASVEAQVEIIDDVKESQRKLFAIAKRAADEQMQEVLSNQ